MIDHLGNIKKEKFSATLGFDFIFTEKDGNKTPWCIEINGEDTGLKGVSKIPSDQITGEERERVAIRMTHTPERISLAAYAESLDPNTQAIERKDAWERTRNTPGFIHAFVNPHYVQNIIKDKKQQQKFIPIENRPRPYKKDEYVRSQTGYWICKPLHGRKGKGIRVVSNEAIEQTFLVTENLEEYSIQEFLLASGAEKSTHDIQNNPASLRLLIDFVYCEDKSIKELFTFGYQRVSPHKAKMSNALQDNLEDVFVVNLARGAYAVAMSQNEYRLAHSVAIKIIHNIAEHFIKI